MEDIMTSTRQRIFVALTLLIGVIFFLPLNPLDWGKAQTQHSEPKILSVIHFSPVPDADVLLKEAKLEILSDGRRKFSATSHPLRGNGRLTFILLADPLTGTYKTVKFKLREGADVRGEPIMSAAEMARVRRKLGDIPQERLPKYQRADPYRVYLGPVDSEADNVPEVKASNEPSAPFNRPPSSPAGVAGCSPCGGAIDVTVRTIDLVGITLTRTNAELDWSSTAVCHHDIFDASDECWANPRTLPPPLTTHWYVDSCTPYFQRTDHIPNVRLFSAYALTDSSADGVGVRG
jgi:hypothetical protein